MKDTTINMSTLTTCTSYYDEGPCPHCTAPCFKCRVQVPLGSEVELNMAGTVRYACEDCAKFMKFLAKAELIAVLARMKKWGVDMRWEYKRNMRNVIAARYGVLSRQHPNYDRIMQAAEAGLSNRKGK